MNIATPASVVTNDQVKSTSANGCSIMKMPSAITPQATSSSGPRRSHRGQRGCASGSDRRRQLVGGQAHLRTAPKVMPRSRCLRSSTVKTRMGTRKSVVPGGDRGPVLAALADDDRDEGRRGLRLAAGEQHRERVFVPGEDQAEDRGGDDAGGGLRQHHLAEGLQAGVAVDHRRVLVLARDLVDEALQQPDGERDVDRAVEQDHAELGVREAELAVHQVDRDRDGDRRHHPGREDEEHQVVLARHLEARERVRGHDAEADREQGRAAGDDQRVEEARQVVGAAHHHHAVAPRQAVAGVDGGRQALDVFLGLARARREEVAVALHRRLEEDLGRIADRVGRALDAGEQDPAERHQGDEGVEHHQRHRHGLRQGRGLDHRMRCAETDAHRDP